MKEPITKVCTKCKVEKPYDNFHLHKSRKDGRQDNCKECIKNYSRDNSERLRAKSIKWYKENLNKAKEKNKKWRKDNPEKTAEYSKKYRQDNFEKIADYNRKRKQENPAYHREYEKKRRQSDPLYKMICYLRNRIGSYCRDIGANRTTRTKDMLGLDLSTFKSYMESKFQDGMTWENYGQWHVDHIKPISLARNEKEIIELNHYTNLQPLWASDNIKKSNRYEEAQHGNYGESFV